MREWTFIYQSPSTIHNSSLLKQSQLWAVQSAVDECWFPSPFTDTILQYLSDLVININFSPVNYYWDAGCGTYLSNTEHRTEKSFWHRTDVSTQNRVLHFYLLCRHKVQGLCLHKRENTQETWACCAIRLVFHLKKFESALLELDCYSRAALGLPASPAALRKVVSWKKKFGSDSNTSPNSQAWSCKPFSCKWDFLHSASSSH